MDIPIQMWWLKPIILLIGRLRLGGLWFRPGQAKKKIIKARKTPSQPINGWGGIHLSSQLHRKLRSGGSWFQASPGKNTCKTESAWKNLGMVNWAYDPSYAGKVQASQGKKPRPYLKNNQSKNGWGMTQMVKHFPANTKHWGETRTHILSNEQDKQNNTRMIPQVLS
jgi:hypothetical protein